MLPLKIAQPPSTNLRVPSIPITDGRGKRVNKFCSTTDTEFLDQSPIAAFIGALEIVKKLATLGHKFQQSPSRVIVLYVLLEMLSEIVNALRQNPDLYLG